MGWETFAAYPDAGQLVSLIKKSLVRQVPFKDDTSIRKKHVHVSYEGFLVFHLQS